MGFIMSGLGQFGVMIMQNIIKMNIIEQLKEKYNLSPDSYYTESPYRKEDSAAYDKHMKECYQPFHDKWIKYTEKNWYGPDGLGFPLPEVFYRALDEFLEYVLKECPEFKILQIKIKFGAYRGYYQGLTEKIQEENRELQNLLTDKFLIY